MQRPCKRRLTLLYVGSGLVGLAALALGLWASLTHTPRFYRQLVDEPSPTLERDAQEFVSRSLQLRNDIANEPTWEAVFSDREVNAWLAEELITHFADQLPPEVHDPRLAFEPDRVTLAFKLDQGPVRSVIWVVARVRVPEDNVLALTLEKIRAGALPVPSERIIAALTEQARKNGLDLTWGKDGDRPVATIRYRADRARTDVVLERVHIRDGQIRLSGRSDRATAAAPRLPSRRALQLNFPRRTTQDVDAPAEAAEGLPPASDKDTDRNSTGPVS